MFLVYCDNYKNPSCGKSTAALYEPTDGKAYCAECDRPITNITKIAINQLKLFHQVRTPRKQTYSIRCESCKIEARPVINDQDALVCPKCSAKSSAVSKPFERLIRDAIANDDDNE